jgi:hypothetical protein
MYIVCTLRKRRRNASFHLLGFPSRVLRGAIGCHSFDRIIVHNLACVGVVANTAASLHPYCAIRSNMAQSDTCAFQLWHPIASLELSVNETKRSFFASSMYIVHLKSSSLKLRFNQLSTRHPDPYWKLVLYLRIYII